VLGHQGGSIGRHRRPSTGYSSTYGRPLADKLFGRTDEEDEAELEQNEEAPASNGSSPPMENHGDEKEYKSVYMKGLFSVATTSTKPPAALKTDIKRVLDRMQVQYRETKTGFECIHMPSIDLASIQAPRPSEHRHRKHGSDGSYEAETARRSLNKKTSKLSFVGRSPKSRERDSQPKDKELPSRPSGGTILTATASSASSSFFHVSSNAHSATVEARSDTPEATNGQPEETPSRSPTPAKGKILPPIPRDFAASPQPMSALPTGEVNQDVFETIGANSLAVRFEINIVKVPWLPLHGIQFRRASGDGWQYHTLARRVLTELKL